jgi:hypothetical protein
MIRKYTASRTLHGIIAFCGFFTVLALLLADYPTTQYQCMTCPAGYYCSGHGGQPPCIGNTYCPPRSSAPQACPIGRACNNGAITGCASGYYGADCMACATAGTYWSGSACATCEAGYYCTGNGNRTQCPSGSTSPEGSTNTGDCIVPTATGLGGQYCAPTNKNVCTKNAAWTGGSNECAIGGTYYTAWDGTTTTWQTPYKAKQNIYGIKASTWACNNSESVAPNAAGDAQCRSGRYCWCAYSKSPDTDPATFASGAWSSWVSFGSYGSASSCAYPCAYYCAFYVYLSPYGGAVSW